MHNYQTSYNLNKGEKIFLCLRDYETHEFHDLNDIMFVAIHELTHCSKHSKGHNKDFWFTFRFLLQNAAEINIYSPTNYKNKPFNYCSTKVKYNPMLDDKLKDEFYFK